MQNIVAIIGRPNVGKSTLFNRLIQTKQAIICEIEETTRDRQYGQSDWCGHQFSIIDTGGWTSKLNNIFKIEINKQVQIAMEEASIILFLLDIKQGITYLDQQIASILRKGNKPIILCLNKADNHALGLLQTAEFYSLGMGDPYPISSKNGSGVGELLDFLVSKLEIRNETKSQQNIPSVAIVGRPNVGKSSLINTFLDTERNIVTSIAGTTRDSIYTLYNKFGLKLFLIDTAGIRKKNKVEENIEYYSIIRSIRSIEYSDVCILIIDATRGLESQDMAIFSLIQKKKKGLVIVVNKWDLIKNKEVKSMNIFKKSILYKIAPFTDVPIIFSSAKTKQRIYKILETIQKVYTIRQLKISTHQLNDVLLPIIEKTPPPIYKGKVIRIKYITQLTHTDIPSFIFFCNLPQWIKSPYKRFLENQLRSNWELTGTPISLFMRKK